MGMDTERAAAIIDIKERALAVDRRYVLYPARLKIGWRIQKLWDCGFESGGFGCVFGIFREDDCLNGEVLYPER